MFGRREVLLVEKNPRPLWIRSGKEIRIKKVYAYSVGIVLMGNMTFVGTQEVLSQ